jgi:hypothetical protein
LWSRWTDWQPASRTPSSQSPSSPSSSNPGRSPPASSTGAASYHASAFTPYNSACGLGKCHNPMKRNNKDISLKLIKLEDTIAYEYLIQAV